MKKIFKSKVEKLLDLLAYYGTPLLNIEITLEGGA